MESKVIRQHIDDEKCCNLSCGASGRRVFYESDIIFIRELYDSKELYITEAYDKYYKDIVTFRAFKKVWHGDTFKDIHYHVYTDENKRFHFAKGQSRPHEQNGKAVLTLSDVKEIRKRRENGETMRNVMKDYNSVIGVSGFTSVWKNRTWKDVI